MKKFAYLSNVSTLKLDRETCIGCGACTEVCPHQVFELQDKKSRIVAFDSCMECGACSRNCPVNAIYVDSGVGCAFGLIAEWARESNIPLLKKLCC